MRCLFCTLALVMFAGCRSQTTTMSNPFLAPNRVPPPATRTLLPGTAQPYYPGDPLPNSPVIGTPPIGPPTGFAPGTTPQPNYVPAPAGVVPPGGWNTTPQPRVSPYPHQQTSYQLPLQQQPFVQQSVPTAESRQVRIRAISSESLPADNLTPSSQPPRSRDGFRPQGSRRAQKPTTVSPRPTVPQREAVVERQPI